MELRFLFYFLPLSLSLFLSHHIITPFIAISSFNCNIFINCMSFLSLISTFLILKYIPTHHHYFYFYLYLFTTQMLRARSFCKHHEYIFALLCLLNVNMGALDLARSNTPDATITYVHNTNILFCFLMI